MIVIPDLSPQEHPPIIHLSTNFFVPPETAGGRRQN